MYKGMLRGYVGAVQSKGKRVSHTRSLWRLEQKTPSCENCKPLNWDVRRNRDDLSTTSRRLAYVLTEMIRKIVYLLQHADAIRASSSLPSLPRPIGHASTASVASI